VTRYRAVVLNSRRYLVKIARRQKIFELRFFPRYNLPCFVVFHGNRSVLKSGHRANVEGVLSPFLRPPECPSGLCSFEVICAHTRDGSALGFRTRERLLRYMHRQGRTAGYLYPISHARVSAIEWTQRTDLTRKYNQQFLRHPYCAAEDALLFSLPAQAQGPPDAGAEQNKEREEGEGGVRALG
jgi:hypothetical protein